MIGILAKLAKAAQLAKQAEAAIDVASSRMGQQDGEPEVPKKLAPVERMPGAVPDPYLAMLKTGMPDARELLPSIEVERIIGKRIRSASLVATADCLVCDYHCKDRAGTVLGLHISKTLPWSGFDDEIDKMEVFDDLGEAAFRGGRQIYVKVGDTVFWIHTAGEVMVDMAVKAARHVVGELERNWPQKN